jgi:MoaA/NifB/PqqE/SkfB family radical SAM enzyme
MLRLTGLHLLLSYQCTFECEHCFVWGSPWQSGVMTTEVIERILGEAKTQPTIRTIYFEGGEPFLYYATLLAGVQRAVELGFEVGIVSNAYWATSAADARAALEPFAGLVQDLTLSSDAYHATVNGAELSQAVQDAQLAAQALGIPTGVISVAQPERGTAAMGQLPSGEARVMYRGRAVEKLTGRAPSHPWESFTACPYEDLRDPGRVHVDPFGNMHICQGIVVGNLLQEPLDLICQRHEAELHYITGPLLVGGPAQLMCAYGLAPASGYADACHLCYTARLALRGRFPKVLGPDQMYGVV